MHPRARSLDVIRSDRLMVCGSLRMYLVHIIAGLAQLMDKTVCDPMFK